MKKILSALVTLTLIFALSATAFATGGPQNSNQGKMQPGVMKTTPPAIGNMRTTPPGFGVNGEAKGELAKLRLQIRENAQDREQIRLQIREVLGDIKEKIELLKNDETNPITEEQIKEIRTALQVIKKDRQEYNDNHKLVMATHREAIKAAHGTKDLGAAKAAMEKIMAEQQLRITDLNHILDQLKALLNDL
jgi:phage host-nuclease inhibitor protein Gam